MDITEFLKKVNTAIVNPLIILIFGIALLVFFWGLYEFITSAETDDGRAQGKRNIIWGVVGMFIMVSVYGIINLVLNTFGVSCPAFINGVC